MTNDTVTGAPGSLGAPVPRLITPTEAARSLGISLKTFRRHYRKRGGIYSRIGERLMIAEPDLTAWLARCAVRADDLDREVAAAATAARSPEDLS